MNRAETKSLGIDDFSPSGGRSSSEDKAAWLADRARSWSDPMATPGTSAGDAKSVRRDSKDVLTSDYEGEVEGEEMEGEAELEIAAVPAEDDTSPEYQCTSLSVTNFLDPTIASPSVKCYLKRQFSTTSTVFATETILVPNLRQVIFCIASVLQAQMVEDYGASPEDKALHPIFNQRIEPAHGLGGDVSEVDAELLQREAPEDEYLRDLLRCRAVPPVDVILRFISCTTSYSQKSAECNIIALVYLNRMNALGRLVLTYENWRCVWVSCFMLAQKMWSDKPLKTSAFEKVCPPLTKSDLRELESYAFKLLEYSTGVKPSVYVKYYFELRQLFTFSMGFSETDWQFRPLSTLQASRMTALYDRTMSSHRHVSKNRKLKEILHKRNPSSKAESKGHEARTDEHSYESKSRFVIS